MEAYIFTRNIIPGFSYPDRYCAFCGLDMLLCNAIHDKQNSEIFKAIFICLNSDCGAFDEAAKKSYTRVYYSCEEALKEFELVRLKYVFEEKK